MTGRNLDRGLHIQVSACDLGARLGQFLADGASCGLGWRRVPKRALAVPPGDFEGGSEEAPENRESDQAAGVAVYFVAQAGAAVGIEAYHAIEIDRWASG